MLNITTQSLRSRVERPRVQIASSVGAVLVDIIMSVFIAHSDWTEPQPEVGSLAPKGHQLLMLDSCSFVIICCGPYSKTDCHCRSFTTDDDDEIHRSPPACQQELARLNFLRPPSMKARDWSWRRSKQLAN